jgi:chromosome segregation ATPase
MSAEELQNLRKICANLEYDLEATRKWAADCEAELYALKNGGTTGGGSVIHEVEDGEEFHDQCKRENAETKEMLTQLQADYANLSHDYDNLDKDYEEQQAAHAELKKAYDELKISNDNLLVALDMN